MARYFLNIGPNYLDAANWSDTSGGAGGFSVPTNTDDVFFDANSGNCTVNNVANAKTINFTGYSGTMTFNALISLTVSGDVTWSNTMTTAGTGSFTISSACNLTTNGKTWTSLLTISANITFVGDLHVTGSFVWTGGSVVANGGVIYLGGNASLSVGSASTWSGTATFVLDGTGILAGNGRVNTNLTINTTGTITIGTSFNWANNGFTLKYIAGTVDTTAGTLICDLGGGTSTSIFDTVGIIWTTISMASSGSKVLLSDLVCSGTFTSQSLGCGFTSSGGNLVIQGSLVCAGGITGTGTMRFTGTGTWSGSGTVNLNMIFNTAGTITISGTVGYRDGTMTYTAGTIVTTGSTLNLIFSCTLNVSAINWNNIVVNSVFGGSPTFTLSSAFNILGNLSTVLGTNTFNGSATNLSGNLTLASGTLLIGTSVLNIIGTCIWSGAGALRNTTNINTLGDFTVSGSVNYSTGTFTYVTAGSVVTTSSTLSILGSCTLNTNGMSWNNISITATSTITVSSILEYLGTLTVSALLTATFNGSNVKCTSFSLGNSSTLTGTSLILVSYPGTFTGVGTCTVSSDITFNLVGTYTLNGNCTFGKAGGTCSFTNTSGDVLAAESSGFTFGSTTGTINFSHRDIFFYTVIFSGTVNYASDLYVATSVSFNTAVLNGFKVYTAGTLRKINNVTVSGTTELIMTGSGSFISTNVLGFAFTCPVTFASSGKITMDCPTVISIGGVFTYISGVIEYAAGASQTWEVKTGASFIGCAYFPFKNIQVNAGASITTDKMFNGVGSSPLIITSAGANYTINVTEPVSVCNFVRISNCTAARPSSILIATIDGNGGGNVGVVYINNGFRGFQNDAWANPNYGVLGYVNNWGQGWQGFTRKK